MTSEGIREEFIEVLKKEFPLVEFCNKVLKSGKTRISAYVPNNRRNKRWMQLDANPTYLSIAMDHSIGEISVEDFDHLQLAYGLEGSKSAIQLEKNNDAVKVSLFVNDPYDLSDDQFKQFLKKHYKSYLNLIRSAH